MLGDGSDFGLQFAYRDQPSPNGLAQAFVNGHYIIGHASVCLELGDNLFFDQGPNQRWLAAGEFEHIGYAIGKNRCGYHVINLARQTASEPEG